MRFVPYHHLKTTPNMIVDGAANDYSVLTLSHWPRSGTPWQLKADLSAEIVFRYLESPEFHVSVEAVSNNHFDEDGLIGLYVLLNPEEARAKKNLLIDIASAGDFGTFQNIESARVAFVLSAFADGELSPLNPEIFQKSYPDTAGELYQEMLKRLPDVLDNPDRYRRFWEAEESQLRQTENAIRSGHVNIEEIPEIDLAIVSLKDRETVCHSMAIHNATKRLRIMTIAPQKYELKYRYETWVQVVSRQPLPRVDLHPLAELLNAKDTARWTFDGVDAIVPKLHMDEDAESSLDPAQFRACVDSFLRKAPAAWNPFDAR